MSQLRQKNRRRRPHRRSGRGALTQIIQSRLQDRRPGRLFRYADARSGVHSRDECLSRGAELSYGCLIHPAPLQRRPPVLAVPAAEDRLLEVVLHPSTPAPQQPTQLPTTSRYISLLQFPLSLSPFRPFFPRQKCWLTFPSENGTSTVTDAFSFARESESRRRSRAGFWNRNSLCSRGGHGPPPPVSLVEVEDGQQGS